MIRDVPVDPDDEQARRWLEDELGRGDEPYQPPEPPGWWQDFLEWLRRLLSGVGAPAFKPPPALGEHTEEVRRSVAPRNRSER